MRKNKKISTENLYIGRVARYKICYKEYNGKYVNTWYRFENLNPPLYTVVRTDIFGLDAYDIFDDTPYMISTERGKVNGQLVVVLEQPIITQDDKIRYKDAEKILETYKDIVSSDELEEYRDNISKVKTKN